MNATDNEAKDRIRVMDILILGNNKENINESALKHNFPLRWESNLHHPYYACDALPLTYIVYRGALIWSKTDLVQAVVSST